MSAFESKEWLKHYTPWTPAHLNYGEETLCSMYLRNLERNPSWNATSFFGAKTTFAELDKKVRSVAAGLRAFGIGPGDTVAILLPNCPQHIIAYQAVLALGAIVVEHNPLYTAHELTLPFQDHKARVAIVWDKAAAMAEELRHVSPLETIISVNMIEAMPRHLQLALKMPIPKLRALREELSAPAPGTVPWKLVESDVLGGDGTDFERYPDTKPEDTAFILYTSGTTGTPKGAELTHGSLVSNLIMGKNWVKNLGTQRERMLAVLPFFHAFGLTMNATLAFYIGGEIILLPAPDMKLIMNAFKKEHPTWMVAVPLLYQRIVDQSKKNNISIKGVRAAFCGASSLPASIVHEWEELTGGLLVEGYGLTETSPIIVGNPYSHDRREGYVGVPFPDTEVKIVDPENPTQILPDGTEGEILVRGPQVFKGYLNNPEATAKSMVDGWYRTGDVGVMEPDGFIKLVSRIKELIITGGFNVYPAEVEEVLLSHPDIEEATVVGLPREDGSERVVAAVNLRDGAVLDPEGLKEYARKALTRYKVPRAFYNVDDMPRDMMGKVRRMEVRNLIMEKVGKK